MNRNALGSSLLSKFSVSSVLVVSSKLSESVALVIPAGGHMMNSLNGLWYCPMIAERGLTTHCYIRYYMLVNSSKWRPLPETKALCSIILEQTIKEDDKYQQGLTKIFFRAGMLASLESLRSNRLNELVTLVQKNVKRRLAVQKYRLTKASAIKIQTWWRGIMAKRFVESIRREVAALRLQRAVRSYVRRKAFLDTRKSVVKLQSRTYCCTISIIL